MSGKDDLANARQQAADNRGRLRARLSVTRDRLTPARLRDDAVDYAKAQVAEVRQETVAHVRQHPVLTVIGVTALIGWIARKPLLAHAPPAIASAYGWLSGQLRFSEIVPPDDEIYSPVHDDDCDSGDVAEDDCDNDNERILP